MAQTTRSNSSRSLFASDGKAHPLQDTLVAVTLILGALAFVTAWFHGLHLMTSVVAVVALLTGAYGQYVSVTTRERFLIIVGLGAALIALILGIGHGGFFE